MPNFKQGGRGFQMKGWSAFSKKEDYTPQSQRNDKEYTPQSQVKETKPTGTTEGISEKLQKNITLSEKNTKNKKNSKIKDFVKKHGKKIGMGILSAVFPGVGVARAGKAIVDHTGRNIKKTKKFIKNLKEFKQWKAKKKK